MDDLPPSGTHAVFARQASSNAGSNRDAGGNSISQLVATIAPIFLISLVIFLAFLVFQKKFDRVYGPRTYLGSLNKEARTPKQTAGILGWRKEFKELKDEFILGHSSIDNYLWLRYFKMLVVMCFGGCVLTWPVLFPVNATGSQGNTGIDMLSFSNVAPGPRYFAQAGVACLFLLFVMVLITRESLFYVHLRQAYFMSPFETSKISSKTVLFVDVPESYRDEAYLRRIFPNVRSIWMVRDPGELADNLDERDQAATKLENGEITMIQSYLKQRSKTGGGDESNEGGRARNIEVDRKLRPTHKLKMLIGKKVDTIDWSRGELRRLIPEVARQQQEHRSGNVKAEGAVFIEFDSVRAAQAAFQAVGHQNPFKMTPADIGMTPDTVNWDNLKKPWYMVKVLNWVCTAFAYFLCIFWTIPVAVIGAISNIDSLTSIFFLEWINQIPSAIIGVVTGLLPVILLSVLMALVPIILMLLANLFAPTAAAAQLRVQSWYFPFQVIQVFLITTFASGAAAVVKQIVDNPTGAPQLLASNLPKASNFFISYFILQGLLITALQFLNVVPLLFVLFLGKILDKTPRKMYNRYSQLGGLGWGSLFPKFTNMGVIALAYSSIAPLILGFATVGFGLLYLGFRYNVLFTLGTTVSTRGRAYGRAMQQLTVGIYISEICLIGLFAIGIGDSPISAGPLGIMIVMLLATILWHVQLRSALSRLATSLPQDLLAEEYRNLHGNDHDGEKGIHNGASNGTSNGKEPHLDATSSGSGYQIPQPQHADAPPKPSGVMGHIKKFFIPTKYASAAVLSKYILSPHLAEPVRPYTDRERADAFLNPAVISEPQIIWIARDQYGLSRQEIDASHKDVGEGLEMTDEDAWFDEKNKVQWDYSNLRKAPIWEDAPIY